jgi:hypothetical protein
VIDTLTIKPEAIRRADPQTVHRLRVSAVRALRSGQLSRRQAQDTAHVMVLCDQRLGEEWGVENARLDPRELTRVSRRERRRATEAVPLSERVAALKREIGRG